MPRGANSYKKGDTGLADLVFSRCTGWIVRVTPGIDVGPIAANPMLFMVESQYRGDVRESFAIFRASKNIEAVLEEDEVTALVKSRRRMLYTTGRNLAAEWTRIKTRSKL